MRFRRHKLRHKILAALLGLLAGAAAMCVYRGKAMTDNEKFEAQVGCFFLIVLVVGLCIYGAWHAAHPIAVQMKTVELKLQVVEQRLTFDPFDNRHARDRAVTVFYLVADDRWKAEVTMDEWVVAKEKMSVAAKWQPPTK